MSNIFEIDTVNDGSKGLVFIGERLLVYRRDYNTDLHPGEIDVPGGGMEGIETPFETFRREIQEEFGLHVHKQDVTYSRQYESKLKPGKHGYFIVIKLPASAETLISFGNEGSEFMLLGIQEYLDRADAWPVFQERTHDYLATLNEQ